MGENGNGENIQSLNDENRPKIVFSATKIDEKNYKVDVDASVGIPARLFCMQLLEMPVTQLMFFSSQQAMQSQLVVPQHKNRILP